jgi:hypothetical protein
VRDIKAAFFDPEKQRPIMEEVVVTGHQTAEEKTFADKLNATAEGKAALSNFTEGGWEKLSATDKKLIADAAGGEENLRKMVQEQQREMLAGAPVSPLGIEEGMEFKDHSVYTVQGPTSSYDMPVQTLGEEEWSKVDGIDKHLLTDRNGKNTIPGNIDPNKVDTGRELIDAADGRDKPPAPTPPKSESEAIKNAIKAELMQSDMGRDMLAEINRAKKAGERPSFSPEQTKLMHDVIDHNGGKDAYDAAREHDRANGVLRTASTMDPMTDFLNNFDLTSVNGPHGPVMYASAQGAPGPVINDPELLGAINGIKFVDAINGQPVGSFAMVQGLQDSVGSENRITPSQVEGLGPAMNDPLFEMKSGVAGPKVA